MKIIHTGDWHIGNTLYQYDREDEHKFFFEQLKQVVIDEHPDAIVVSGDVFDNALPTIASQKLFYQSIVDLSRLDEDLQIIITAGNHDSPSRLEAPKLLWNAFNVTVVGTIERNEDSSINYSKMLVPVTRKGIRVGWVLAVPYIYQTNFPSEHENDTLSQRVNFFYSNLLAAAYDQGCGTNEPVVATGHFYVNGSDIQGHGESVLGGLESIAAKALHSFPVHYWALGHIHHPQMIDKHENLRYSGSPFAINFDEKYPHFVNVVNVNFDSLEVLPREIKPLVSLTDIPSTHKCLTEVLTQLNAISSDNPMYVRVKILTTTNLTPTEKARIIACFEGKQARFCYIDTQFVRSEKGESKIEIRNLSELKRLQPMNLAVSYFNEHQAVEMTTEMQTLLNLIIAKINTEINENQ